MSRVPFSNSNLSVKTLQDIFSAYLKKQSFNAQPRELYEPIEYTLNLGGKRLRPLLLLMARNLYGNNVIDALDAAIAIEIFHNFTLLHDDIMDQAPLRRNQATVYKKWNTNIAILSGDVMLVKAYEYLLKTKKEIITDIIAVFNHAAIQVCEGQQFDMNFENRDDVSIVEYIKMIELKTAVLLAASLKIGAMIGDAPIKDAEKLYEFGKNMGIAFQLQDDLLDAFGNENEFGKQKGGDIIANKKTYLLLKAQEMASSEIKARLYSAMYENSITIGEKVNVVLDCYNKLDIETETQKQIQYYHQKALESLNDLSFQKDKLEPILSLSNNLLHRKS